MKSLVWARTRFKLRTLIPGITADAADLSAATTRGDGIIIERATTNLQSDFTTPVPRGEPLLKPLGDLLLDAAARYPEAPHIIKPFSGERIESQSYDESARQARSVAAHLMDRGLEAGQAVAVFGDALPFQIAAAYGVWLAGGVLVVIDPQWGADAVGRALRKARVKVALFPSERCEALAEADLGKTRFLPLDPALFAARRTLRALPDVDPRSRALILFTSGTTGEPKAAVLRHEALLWSATRLCRRIHVEQDDNMLCVLPIHNVFSLVATIILPVLRGARLTMPGSLKGPDIVRSMRSTGVTLVPAVPQMLVGFDRAIRAGVEQAGVPERLLFPLLTRFVRACRSLGWNPGPFLFGSVHEKFGRSLRLFGSGGAALDPQVARRLWSLGLNVIEGYGLTETGPAICIDRPERPRFGSVGRPLPGVDIRIHRPDETGVGEVVVSSPARFEGYLDDPEETAKILRDGWIYTGDLGRMDADGRLYITGRIKEVIVLGSGKKVYPQEVETRLEENSYIAEACVLGVPVESRLGTEKLHAVLVPDFDSLRRDGISRIEATLRGEVNKIGDSLPSHHRILGITVRAMPLPRTPLGKLRRFQVYEEVVATQRSQDTRASVTAEPPPQSGYWKTIEKVLRHVSGRGGPIGASSGLELDLGLDSLARVEVLALLEEKLGVKLPEGFGAEALTAGDVLKEIETFLNSKDGVSGFEAMRTRAATVNLRTPGRRLLQPFGRLILFLLHLPARILFRWMWRFRVEGVRNLPAGAHLICPNHGSYLDPVIILTALPLRFGLRAWWLGHPKIFGRPVMRVLALLGNVIRVDANAGLRATLELGGAALATGAPLVLFPEGTRAPAGERLPFQRGAAILSRTAGVPMVPTWLEGVDLLLARGRFWPRLGHQVTVRFGQPIDPHLSDGARDPAQALTDLLRQRVDTLAGMETPHNRS